MPSSPQSSPSRHRRSTSHTSASIPRSPSPPSQTFHPSLLPRTVAVPTPSLVDSVAGAAHYSGIRVGDADAALKHRHSVSHEHEHGRGSQVLQVSADHRRVLDDLRELYCCRPTVELLERLWHRDAVFEDPWTKCKGFSEYAALWFSMPKLFSHSETLTARIMASTQSPNQMMFFLKQEYTYRLLGRKKIIESIVIVDLDEHNKIVRLVDQHDGKLPTWPGSHLLRRLNAKLAPWLVSVPKAAGHAE